VTVAGPNDSSAPRSTGPASSTPTATTSNAAAPKTRRPRPAAVRRDQEFRLPRQPARKGRRPGRGELAHREVVQDEHVGTYHGPRCGPRGRRRSLPGSPSSNHCSKEASVFSMRGSDVVTFPEASRMVRSHSTRRRLVNASVGSPKRANCTPHVPLILPGYPLGPRIDLLDRQLISTQSHQRASAHPVTPHAIALLTLDERDRLVERRPARTGVTHRDVLEPDRHAREEDEPVRG
jgi:hypothetical protein